MWKSVLTLVAVLAVASPSFAQNYPMPRKVGEAPAICEDCKSLNSAGEPNLDKPTWQFSAPLSAHAGRMVDSQATQNIQHMGHRTLRAGLVRTAYLQRGTAPPRVYAYIGLGTFGAYSLDTFLTTLKNPMATVKEIGGTNVGLRKTGLEKAARPDAIVYPEGSRSGWQVPFVDSTERLKDFDFDDRGYVYLAYDIFGFGIVKDSGETGIHTLPLVSQVFDIAGLQPDKIISLKSGNKYYVAVSYSGNTLAGRQIYDVTDPGEPVLVGQTSGSVATKQTVISSWAKDDTSRIVAVIASDGALRIYTYDGYVRNDPPVEELTSDTDFVSVTIDDKGVIWAVENPKGNNPTQLRRISGSATGGFSDTILTPWPEWFEPIKIHARSGYLASVGRVRRGAREIPNGFVFKTEGNGISLLDTQDFFLKYYHAAPSGFAQPEGYTSSPQDVHILKVGTKTYLMYMVYGLGDVYQLEGSGPSLSIARRDDEGTPNPFSQGTSEGPFPGDPVTFRATISGATGVHGIGWNFGNPEDTAGNVKSGSTGVNITHQFTGLSTVAKIEQARPVTATLSGDSSVSDTLTVDLEVPTARIALEATEKLVTEGNFAVLVGDHFVDASDGTVESHVANWKIDNTPSKKKPDEPVSVGDLGDHTVQFTAAYGKYDEENFTISGAPFNVSVASMSYRVVPFLATIRRQAGGGATATYVAENRFSEDPAILTAKDWTYTWTLESKTGTEKAKLTVENDDIGSIDPFPFSNSLLANEDVVRLEISVLESEVPGGDEFATFAVEQEVNIPDPKIELTNCGFVNDLCSIKAVSASGRSTAGWQLSWTVKQGTTTVASGTGNPLATFKLNNEGSHTVSVHDTIFNTSPVTKTFTVEEAQCGAPPTVAQLAIDVSCSSCKANEEITFKAVPFHYSWQDCDVVTWDFNDGTTATGITVKKTYTSTNKTYKVKVTVKNAADTTGTSITKTVIIGSGGSGGGGEEPGTCAEPVGISFGWAGPNGCGSGVNSPNCKAGQTIVFTGTRGSGNLLSCDTATWTIGGETKGEKRPSHIFNNPGSFTVTLKVTNNSGKSDTETRTVTIDPAGTGGGSCNAAPTVANVSLSFRGVTSGCTKSNGITCQRGETIEFTTGFFNYTQQSCDRFDFTFDDGTPALTGSSNSATTRVLAGSKATYQVAVKVYNQNNTAGVTATATVPFTNVPVLQPPTLTTSFPTQGTKGKAMTFTVTSNVPATGWKWEFDGEVDLSQQNMVGTSSTITRTFTTTGRKAVRVTARNAADTSANPPTSNKLVSIDIDEAAEALFLLPIVGHAPGQAGSNWRTDVQFYNPNPNVGPNNPLIMQVTFNGTTKELRITDSTFIYPDFMTFFTNETAIGPMIISAPAEHTPQIWTRTYNQSDNGTFGQFIPAIRLDEEGGGAAVGSGLYYLAGLRHDARYRTNIGFVNPNTQTINATVRVYDEHRNAIAQFAKTLPPLQYMQFLLANEVALPSDRAFYLEIEVPEGKWVIAYASYIDSLSNDPLYLQAVRETELSSEDFRTMVVPGVGHTGQWRSDVTIFNPDREAMNFDLVYYDGAGVKRGEAKSIVLKSRESLQYNDILKQGVFGAEVPDGAGILEIKTLASPIPNTRFPMAFSRTYFDQPGQGTYGQLIGGVAKSRANVKLNAPAIIAGVRSDEHYYTNVGVTNLSNAPAVVTIKLLNPQTGQLAAQIQDVVQPNASRIGGFDFGPLTQGTIQVETDSGDLWTFASVIDRRTRDPEYVPGTPRR